jgi:Stealth protein CR4, conserved region 4/Stealth protein CR3, conserved region 3
VLTELEQRFPEVFESVMHSKFRHPEDLSIASNLHHYYAYCAGRAVPGDISYLYQDLTQPDSAVRLQWLLQRRTADTFCLNDTYSDADQRRSQVGLLGSFLERYFPVPSSFEIDPT